MEHCVKCGASPCWSSQGDVKVSGGLCRQCTSGPGSHAVATHCSNCGEAQEQHQWAMVAVSDRVCVRCAQWYVTRARTSRLWTTESRRRHRMRGLIRSLIPGTCPFGSEMVVTAVMEALHSLSRDGPSAPGGSASSFRWVSSFLCRVYINICSICNCLDIW